jgi:hypothetical protein
MTERLLAAADLLL